MINKPPHWTYDKITPSQYENYIEELPVSERNGLHLYPGKTQDENSMSKNQLSLFD